MHNELFNPIGIFSYYQQALLRNDHGDRWNTLGRDQYPEAFLQHIWTGKLINGQKVKERSKAIGFKSFPDHWTDANNLSIWEKEVMEDHRVKKVILVREDELAVYVSMRRAETTGNYMTRPYPKNLTVHVDPAAFQVFVNNYWDTYRRRYKSAFEKRDTFWILYEQLVEEQSFESDILPLLWKFLGVDDSQPLKKLRETIKQAAPEDDMAKVISNYEELEFYALGCLEHRGSRSDIAGCSVLLPALFEFDLIFRINAKRPYDKKMGPIPHVLMYMTLLPYSFQWLLSSMPSKSAPATDKIHYGFILYTTATTAISLLMDSKVIYQMVQGKDPGLYPFAPKDSGDEKKE